jgi:hypothetical protein
MRCHTALCEWANIKNLEINDLPERIRNVLFREGLTTREAVRNAIHLGELHPKRIGNYGWGSHKFLCQWIKQIDDKSSAAV